MEELVVPPARIEHTVNEVQTTESKRHRCEGEAHTSPGEKGPLISEVVAELGT
jgi:hypothetical protein